MQLLSSSMNDSMLLGWSGVSLWDPFLGWMIFLSHVDIVKFVKPCKVTVLLLPIPLLDFLESWVDCQDPLSWRKSISHGTRSQWSTIQCLSFMSCVDSQDRCRWRSRSFGARRQCCWLLSSVLVGESLLLRFQHHAKLLCYHNHM